ncbi:MAG: nucleotidyltransferase domain-containing protein [Janthinobacterium lividum]
MSDRACIEQLIADLPHHLADELGFHTAILYGSHARGDWDAASDIDVMAFRDGADPTHAAGRWRDVFLDLFVYPSDAEATPDWLRIHGGRVLFQRNGGGDRVLSSVAALYEAGPSLLDAVAAQTRCLWLEKMLARAAKGDVEGNFRRHWLLSALLEDYCALRGRWYLGPKQALLALARECPRDLAVLGAALEPGATLKTIGSAVALVVSVGPGTR